MIGRLPAFALALFVGIGLLLPRSMVHVHSHEGGDDSHDHSLAAILGTDHDHDHGEPDDPDAATVAAHDHDEHSHVLGVETCASALRRSGPRALATACVDPTAASSPWAWTTVPEPPSAARLEAGAPRQGRSALHHRSTTERLVQGLGLRI